MGNSKTTLRNSALAYLQPNGYRPALKIFPLIQNGKTPRIARKNGGHGCLDASDSAEKIAEWWTAYPYSNIGIATGRANNCIVIDVDIKPNEGKYGDETLETLIAELGELPPSWETITPSGGRHLWFKYPDGYDIRDSEDALGRWIDVRANGGYVVGAPSVLKYGSYQWEASSIPCETDLAELPQTWIDRLASVSSGKGSSGGNGKKKKAILPDDIPEGTRNGTLFKYGASRRAQGDSPSEIWEKMITANQRATPPLSDDELKRIYDSVMKYSDGDDASSALLEHINEQNVKTKKGIVDLLIKITPDKSRRYRQSDLGSGFLFADVFKNIARYVPERKAWYIYDGRIWKIDIEGKQAMELCKTLANALYTYGAEHIDSDQQRESYLKFANRWQGRGYRETILKDASSVYPISATEFDKDPWLLNCQNGTLNLDTLEFNPHNPEDYLTKMSGVNYNPQATCERWEKFIDEVMSGDKGKALFLQKSLGYSLTGDASEECFFILYGATSRNGKTTTMQAFQKMIGDYGKACSPETITQKQTANGSAPSEDLARLQGARFVNISEPDKAMILSSSLVKSLTGNNIIRARYLHENSIEFQPNFKLYIDTNHLPAVTDPTVFSSDRVKVIPFDRHFGEAERDTSLKSTFSKAENLSAILNWCIDGLRLYRETGLSLPASVQEATDLYRHDSDKVSRFIEDEMIANPNAETTIAEAFARWVVWTQRNGFKSGSIKSFSQDIRSNVPVERKRPCAGGEKTTVVMGYELTQFKLLGGESQSD